MSENIMINDYNLENETVFFDIILWKRLLVVIDHLFI